MRLDVTGPDTSYGWTVEHSTDTPRTGIGLSHVRWDSYHYLRLAQFGYHRAEDAAYYPAYPVLMRGVTEAITRPLMPWASALQQYAVAGLAISIVATLPAVWAMHALARDVLGSDVDALRATAYLLIFPTTFFMLQVYTEALYLALAIPALLMAVRRRWWAAACSRRWRRLRATGFLLVGASEYTGTLTGEPGRRSAWRTLGAGASGGRVSGAPAVPATERFDQDAAFAGYGRSVLNLDGLREISHQLADGDRSMGAVQIGWMSRCRCWRCGLLARPARGARAALMGRRGDTPSSPGRWSVSTGTL